MVRILMVCLGNICRSPLAEGILKSKLNSELFTVDSAATSGHHQGELPDPRSIDVAKKYGIDITNQRSRPFTKKDFQTFDYIYVMDDSNYNDVTYLAQSEEDMAKVSKILEQHPTPSTTNVPDPYYGGNDGFENVYQLLDTACTAIATKLA